MAIGNRHQQAMELARGGQMDAAFEAFDAYLREFPDHGSAWNDAGAVLYAQGRYAEAIRYFSQAVDLQGHPPQTYRNLVRAYLAAGRPWQAMGWFETLCGEGLLDAELVEQIAEAFIACRDCASAMEVLWRGRAALPDADRLAARIEALRGRRAKIAFFWGGDGPTFLNDILDYARGRYQVRTFEGKTTGQMHELMQWSDISWFEWCTDEMVVAASRLPKVCRTIVRLHRWEAYLERLDQINWQTMDVLMLVGNSFVRQALEQQVPDIARRIAVVTIPNGVNLDKFKFRRRKKGKKIVQLGHLRMIKRPDFTLQCMKKLYEIDPDYHLHFAGRWQDDALQQYLWHMTRQLGLEDVVHFDGYQSDVETYLEDVDYNVSSSLSESQGMGLLEAMARGIKPVIHHFPGAEEIFGREFLFRTPEEFCQRVLEPSYTPQRYRVFVERRYPLAGQLRHINELLAMFEKDPWTQQPGPRSEQSSALSALSV